MMSPGFILAALNGGGGGGLGGGGLETRIELEGGSEGGGGD